MTTELRKSAEDLEHDLAYDLESAERVQMIESALREERERAAKIAEANALRPTGHTWTPIDPNFYETRAHVCRDIAAAIRDEKEP